MSWTALRSVACVVLALAGLVALPRAAGAPALTVAAASDLQAVLPQIVTRFQATTGVAVEATFGSSGNFFTQIQNGAPFDVFLSADIDYPRRLDAAGLAAPGSLYPYAIGRIVLWARTATGLDLTRGLAILTDARVRYIAIANPEHAPYGRAAVAALTHEHLYDQVRDRLVLGDNISQTATFVESGNAQAGILALSLALAPPLKDDGAFYEIPAAWHPPIEQAAIIPKSSAHQEAARQFLAFLKTPETVARLAAFGFTAPDGRSP